MIRSETTTRLILCALCVAVCMGCGTTKMSDTARTATEQLLISTAVDRSLNQMNFEILRGKDVFLDTQYLKGSVDENYIVSSLRQHLLSFGCHVKERREESTYVLEARSGGVGTNRSEVTIGIPSINLPGVSMLTGAPSSLPEIPFAKTTDQRGLAKLAVFAYNRKTNQPIWQSGAFPITTTAKDTWFLGAGPFQRGSIYDGTRFAGNRLLVPFKNDKTDRDLVKPKIPVSAEAIFDEAVELAEATAPVDVSANPPPQGPAAANTPPAPAPAAGGSSGAAGSTPSSVNPAGHTEQFPANQSGKPLAK